MIGLGEFLDKTAYSHQLDSSSWLRNLAAADADGSYSMLPRLDNGGSDAPCLGAPPVRKKISPSNGLHVTPKALLNIGRLQIVTVRFSYCGQSVDVHEFFD